MQKHFLHGLMTWEVTPRNVWKDIANLRTKRLHNYSMDDHQCKEENESVGDLWGTIWNHVGHMDVTSWSRWTSISVRSCILWGVQTWSNHSSQQVLSNSYLGREICLADRNIWSYELESLERNCQLADKKVEQLNKVSTPCLDDHQFRDEELEIVGESSNSFQIVLKCLH